MRTLQLLLFCTYALSALGQKTSRRFEPGTVMAVTAHQSAGNNTLSFAKTFPADSPLDWSKARGDYFSMKQRHLSEVLHLTDDQKAKIKPTLEQEAAEAGAILWNPAVSRKDRMKDYEKLVSSSDMKIKPFLSPSQIDGLRQLRKEQKHELKNIILEGQADKQN